MSGRDTHAVRHQQGRRILIAASAGREVWRPIIEVFAWRGSSGLNRKKTNISPLVAARIRPVRQRPFGARPDGCTGGLRIARSDRVTEASSALPSEKNASSELEEVRRTAGAMRREVEALSRIHDLLANLSGLLGPLKEGRRRPPRASAVMQQAIDSTLDAIGAIIETAQSSDGGKFLEGDWDGVATARAEGTSRRADDVRSRPRPTDAARSTGFLAMLRSGGTKSADRVDSEEILAIVQSNAAKIVLQRSRLEAFLSERVMPLLGLLEVTAENISANGTALQDADFASSVGQITGGEVLLNLSHIGEPEIGRAGESDPTSARLTIRHNDE